MLFRLLSTIFLGLALATPTVALGASATQNAYDDNDVPVVPSDDGGSDEPTDDVAGETDGGSETPAPAATSNAAPTQSSGTAALPFTGLEAGLIGLAGLGLAGTGLALRRATRAEV